MACTLLQPTCGAVQEVAGGDRRQTRDRAGAKVDPRPQGSAGCQCQRAVVPHVLRLVGKTGTAPLIPVQPAKQEIGRAQAVEFAHHPVPRVGGRNGARVGADPVKQALKCRHPDKRAGSRQQPMHPAARATAQGAIDEQVLSTHCDCSVLSLCAWPAARSALGWQPCQSAATHTAGPAAVKRRIGCGSPSRAGGACGGRMTRPLAAESRRSMALSCCE